MSTKRRKTKIGIVGCGAIGSRVAKSIRSELKETCYVAALFDIDKIKAQETAKRLSLKGVVKSSLKDLVRSCDFVVEAVSAKSILDIVKTALSSKKSILVLSVGKILGTPDLLKLAKKNNCVILFPSGAISAIDAIKAASLERITHITLTTRKPPSSLAQTDYLTKKGIRLNRIKGETVIFDGGVKDAVKYFPKNINVAATLALASGALRKIRIRIVTSPKFKSNSHEIEVIGASGRITSKTENVPCKDNPKTSYLAVLSAIQTLKQHFNVIKIGT